MDVFFPELDTFLGRLEIAAVSEERREMLDVLLAQLQRQGRAGETVRLNFICTHNSRRSHLSQVWAQTLAAYHEVPGIHCYSGGTESTALFPVVAATLKAQGFTAQVINRGDNPVYAIKYGPDSLPIIGFSKRWDHPFNPQQGFVAVMSCTQADADCPYIPGARARIPLPYEDPKLFDGSPLQLSKYEERSFQIAQEMNYVFSVLKRSI